MYIRINYELVYAASATTRNHYIGFIGLGNMGKGMARNVIVKARKVAVYDINPETMDPLVTAGAVGAKSAEEVGDLSDRIITMLPDNATVEDVFYNGILKTIRPGAICIDGSTIDPHVSRELAAACKEKHVDFVDAPVSGGVNAAAAGTLTFMVGAGDPEVFERACDVLELMGSSINHCGAIGMGNTIKICNNMLLAISMIGVAETMNLGMK